MLMVVAVIISVIVGWNAGKVLMKATASVVSLPEPFPLEVNATAPPEPSAIQEWQDNSPFMVVNGTTLPRWQYVNGILASAREAGWQDSVSRDDFERLHSDVVDNMLNMELLYQEAVRRGFGSRETTGAFKARHVKKMYGDDAGFLIALARSGMSEEQFVRFWRRQSVVDAMIRDDLMAHAEVSEEEERTYYETHEDDFMLPERVRAESITMSLAGCERSDCDLIRDRMRILRDRSQMQPMDEAAREYPAAVYDDLGWCTRENCRDKACSEVFSLEDGAVSGVLDRDGELVIFKRLRTRVAEAIPFEQTRDEIHTIVRESKSRAEVDKLLRELRNTIPFQILDEPKG
jgi:peptidyl-prolyl cis-trans isomerase C